MLIPVYYYLEQKLKQKKIGDEFKRKLEKMMLEDEIRLERSGWKAIRERWQHCKESEAAKLLESEMANPDSEVNQVIDAAREEAHKLNHDHVGSEHLLLVLVLPEKEKRTFLSREFDAPEKMEHLREAVKRFSRVRPYSVNEPFSLTANAQQILKDGAYFVCCIGYTHIDRDVLAERLCRLDACAGCKVLQHLGHDPYALAVAFKFATRGVV